VNGDVLLLESINHMGTTFVTIREGNTGDEPGFWMRDHMLELWLRLLALHLPEPTNQGEHSPTTPLAFRSAPGGSPLTPSH
jgi:hypothetical protein